VSDILCRQCGLAKDDNGFLICGTCYDANAKYITSCDKLRREFRNNPAHHRKRDSGLISKEYVGRTTRHASEYASDTDCIRCERNTRTDYHGGNYEDE
jgi:hypothetical protein